MPPPNRLTRGHSCLSCQKRKVKCDGQRPCSSCTRNGEDCYSAPKYRIEKNSQQSITVQRLLSRLERYKDTLQSLGVNVEDDTLASTPSPSQKGQLIVKRGDSRYVEHPLWNGLGDELQDYNSDRDDESDVRTVSYMSEDMLFQNEFLLAGRQFVQLTSLHPTPPQIFQLWQIFLDRFNPLVKLFHAPSVQKMIMEVASDVENAPNSQIALMFAIYLAAVTSSDEKTCQKIFFETKPRLVTRFANAARQALVNVEFLRSTNLIVLQALTIYLLATRRNHDPQSLWLLSGVATRIGQAMGLHREASLQAFSPFEREIRRRLWWQILILDSRSAQLSGVAADSPAHIFWDTKRPANASDCDLVPSMREDPIKSDGPTEMLFCCVRFEIGECMRQLKSIKMVGGKTGHELIAAQEAAIDDLETRLEQNFLKSCDPSISLHLISIYLARSAICLLRFSTYHSFQEPNANIKRSDSDKNILFTLSLRVLHYDHAVYSNPALDRYFWHVETSFPFEVFILILTELLTRVEGQEVDSAWGQVIQVYEDHRELLDRAKRNMLYFAVGSLTLKAWDKKATARWAHQHSYQIFDPPIIATLRAQRTVKDMVPWMSAPTSNRLGDVSNGLDRQPNLVVPAITNEANNAMTSVMSADMTSDQMVPTSTDMLDVDWKYWQWLIEEHGQPFFDV